LTIIETPLRTVLIEGMTYFWYNQIYSLTKGKALKE
jgi:hypothetical protein